MHPVQLLARERWLRADVMADPSSVGAAHLRPVEMTTEAEGLKDAHPAAALGVDLQGSSLLVVCSRGVDLSLVPLAADTRAMVDPAARLVLAGSRIEARNTAAAGRRGRAADPQPEPVAAGAEG